MNNQIREEIRRFISDLEGIKNRVEEIQADEQDKFDNLPEGLQNGEKGELLQAAADSAQSALDELQTAIDALDGAIANLDDTRS